MYPDGEIVLRMFEYGYRHALTVRGEPDKYTLCFPEPCILYLYEERNAPDYQEITIKNPAGDFSYVHLFLSLVIV